MITQFKDTYRWLSNFHKFEKPMEYDGMLFITNEHFYVAMKTTDKVLRQKVASHPLKGLKAFGNTLPLRADWDGIKDAVMLYGLRYKFSVHNPKLRTLLISTGSVEIQEGNWWNDKYWGVCLKMGEGENRLGKLLMQVREETK